MDRTLKTMCFQTVILFAAVALAGCLIFGCSDFISAFCLHLANFFSWLWPERLLVLFFVVVLSGGLLLIWWPILSRLWRTKCVAKKGTAQSTLDPYPDKHWECISDFRYDSDLHLVRLKKKMGNIPREAQYIVVEDFKVSFCLDGCKKHVKVPRGLVTDLVSVPRPGRLFVGRVGPHLEACILHDYLYCAWQKSHLREQQLEPTEEMREFSDKLMLGGLYAADMCIKAQLIYWAVRWCGGPPFFRTTRKAFILSESKLCDITGKTASQGNQESTTGPERRDV